MFNHYSTGRLFRWTAFDNRLLCILHDESIQDDEVSCFTELNEDMSIKTLGNIESKQDEPIKRFLAMEDVEKVQNAI